MSYKAYGHQDVRVAAPARSGEVMKARRTFCADHAREMGTTT